MHWRLSVYGITSPTDGDPDDGRRFWVGLFNPFEAVSASQSPPNPLRPAIAPASALVAEEGDQSGDAAHA